MIKDDIWVVCVSGNDVYVKELFVVLCYFLYEYCEEI